MLDKIPHGYDEIIEVFGDPTLPGFTSKLKTFRFPIELTYMGRPSTRGTCHYLAVDHFIMAMELLKETGLDKLISTYHGIYAPRSKRGLVGLPSTHALAIAIDFNADMYPLGSCKRFPDEFVAVWQKAGFFYGGDFEFRKDPMHFQLCTGY